MFRFGWTLHALGFAPHRPKKTVPPLFARVSGASEELSFWEVAHRAKACGDLLVGYRLSGEAQPVLNPTDKALKRSWGPGDVFVVLAEEDMQF